MKRGLVIALLVVLYILTFILVSQWRDPDADLPHDDWNVE